MLSDELKHVILFLVNGNLTYDISIKIFNHILGFHLYQNFQNSIHHSGIKGAATDFILSLDNDNLQKLINYIIEFHGKSDSSL